MKIVQIRSYFWSAFFRIQSEYRKIRTRNNSVFGHFSRSAIPLRLSGHSCQKNAYWRKFLKFIGKVKNQQNINHLKCILGFNKHKFDHDSTHFLNSNLHCKYRRKSTIYAFIGELYHPNIITTLSLKDFFVKCYHYN